MPNLTKFKKALFLLIFLTIFSFYFFEVDNVFTIQFLKENNALLVKHINENFISSIVFFYLIFFIFIFFFIPMTTIMVVFSSYLFGTLTTIFLSLLIVTSGGLSNIFLLKKLTFEKIFKKAERFAKKIKTKIHGNEIQYLILLRFIPMPFIIQNAIIVLLNTSRIKFIISTMLGVSPYIIIYSLAGFKLKELISLNNEISMEDILNYENFLIIGFFILLIFLSIFLKKKIK